MGSFSLMKEVGTDPFFVFFSFFILRGEGEKVN